MHLLLLWLKITKQETRGPTGFEFVCLIVYGSQAVYIVGKCKWRSTGELKSQSLDNSTLQEVCTYILDGEWKFLQVRVSIKGGWLGQIQSRKMADRMRFKFTKLSTYIASQWSYTDATPSTSVPRVCILTAYCSS